MKAIHLMLFSIVILIGSTSYLGYDLYNTKIELNNTQIELASTTSQLKSTEADLEAANNDIAQKKSEISSLKGEVTGLIQEVTQNLKEIGDLTKQSEEQKKDISRLRGILSDLDDTGNLISENYDETLILYDNSEMFELFKPLWQVVEAEKEEYSKLGIAFIYFRDESKKYEEQTVLGQYNTLFDTIFIYSDASSTRTIYHEIAHTIYKRVFEENQNNQEIWDNLYDQLKEAQLLSSQYAYTNELEGFAEEYAYYKTGLNANQPQAVKDLMEQVDESLRWNQKQNSQFLH